MFISFDPLLFIVWLIISTLIPGAVLSLSIFRKDAKLLFIEKVLLGFALGIVIIPIFPFFLYFFAGVNFSYFIAILSVIVLYAIALVFFFKNKLYEDFKVPDKIQIPKDFFKSKEFLITLSLLIILLAGYIIRLSSYSPIFQELDPYFYTYIPYQILTLGHNPLNDSSAWFPEYVVNHRTVPMVSYLEAVYYSLYSGGAKADNMLLALVSSMYPPVMAILFAFFVYMLVSLSGKREWGLVSAGIAAFLPIIVLKLTAGEEQIVPYSFFALFFFFSMYAFAIKTKDLKFALLAGLALFAAIVGANAYSLAIAAVIIFSILQSVLVFFRDGDTDELKNILIVNSISFVIGVLIGNSISSLFTSGHLNFSISLAYLLTIAFTAALYVVKIKVHDRANSLMILGIVILLGIIIYVSTPLGAYVKSFAGGYFGLAQYNVPLDKTIAEQSPAGTDFSGEFGFVASSYNEIVSMILFPLSVLSPTASSGIINFFSGFISLLFEPFTLIVNLSLSLIISILNIVLGTSVSYSDKDSSIMLFFVFIFWLSLIYSLLKFTKKDDNLFILFIAIIMPPFLVGILKSKLTTYAAVSLAVLIGFSFAPIENFLGDYYKDEATRKKIYMTILAIGVVIIVLQFAYRALGPSLVWGSFQTLYQNNPTALAAKFQSFCSASGDSTVCAAAANPIGFAANATNNQYNENLCLLSVFSQYSYLSNPGNAPVWEQQAAYFRCQFITPYWINTMEWIKENTPADARITSWWDYGHWINYFGERDTVLRNDQYTGPDMVGAVADAYLNSTPANLKQWMEAHGSEYAIFDMELISGGGQLGGKYGALNYLSCAYDNQTTIAQDPGASQCEADHLWETVYISQTPCVISSLSNITGLTTYKIYQGNLYTPSYPTICENPTNANDIAYCQDVVKAVPTYCAGNVTLANGQSTYGLYYLNQTYPNGDLQLDKGILQMPFQIPTTTSMGPVTGATVFYTEDPIWLDNGAVTSGYSDRKGQFYDSVIYHALFLDDLPGFKEVYVTPDGAVKIYQINNYTSTVKPSDIH